MRRPALLRSPAARGVSKRELYSLVGNKQKMLIACIAERSRQRLRCGRAAVPRDRETLGQIWRHSESSWSARVSDPSSSPCSAWRSAGSLSAPEVGRALDSIGRETTRAALRKIMSQGTGGRTPRGRPAELAEKFAGTSVARSAVGLLLGVTERPGRARSLPGHATPRPLPSDHS